MSKSGLDYEPKLISDEVDPVAVFDEAKATFSDILKLERIVSASRDRALFEAYDLVLGRRTALRVHRHEEEAGRIWFERETSLLASLDHHPGFRTVYSAGCRSGWSYRISRWLEGESLQDAMARGARPLPMVLRIARDLTDALEFAHAKGVVVRRIMPTTVMLPLAGWVTVTDLRFANNCLEVGGPDLYRDRDAFLAPEARNNQLAESSSDVYTLGALLYYAVTGQVPHVDPKQLTAPCDIRNTCPKVLERVIMRAMQAEPSHRYLTAAELAHDLVSDLGQAEPSTGFVPTLTSSDPKASSWEHRLRRALGDDYELLNELGSGGFGRVYRVRDLGLEREVALKILHPYWTNDPSVLDRFQREARLAARLSHPNIVNIYDIDSRAGVVWYTMEYVAGKNLADIVDQKERLTVKELLPMLEEALSALEHAHRHGVIHRDLKPENILIDDSSGSVRITDFGLALALKGTEDLPMVESHSGTPEFAAPEQLLGEKVDTRADLYSLTIVAYFCLLGRSPYGSSSPEVVAARQTTGRMSLGDAGRDIPAAVLAALARGSAHDPADRFASASEYRSALKQAERKDPSRNWLRDILGGGSGF